MAAEAGERIVSLFFLRALFVENWCQDFASRLRFAVRIACIFGGDDLSDGVWVVVFDAQKPEDLQAQEERAVREQGANPIALFTS